MGTFGEDEWGAVDRAGGEGGCPGRAQCPAMVPCCRWKLARHLRDSATRPETVDPGDWPPPPLMLGSSSKAPKCFCTIYVILPPSYDADGAGAGVPTSAEQTEAPSD